MSIPPTNEPAPSGAAAPKITPSSLWVWLGLALVLIGPIGCGALLYSGGVAIKNAYDDAQIIESSTTSSFKVDSGGTVAVIATGQSSLVGGVTAEITNDDTGARVTLDSASSFSANGELDGGESFELLGTFDADEGVSYTVAANGPPGTDVRVGGFPTSAFTRIFGGLAAGVALPVIGALLALIVGLRRRSNRKKLAPVMAYPNMPPPTGGPGYPAGAVPPPPGGFAQPAPGAPAPQPPNYGSPPPAAAPQPPTFDAPPAAPQPPTFDAPAAAPPTFDAPPAAPQPPAYEPPPPPAYEPPPPPAYEPPPPPAYEPPPPPAYEPPAPEHQPPTFDSPPAPPEQGDPGDVPPPPPPSSA